MSKTTLTVEVLSGPLDGYTILLTGETVWTQAESSPLSFLWDDQLGTPQAHFSVEGREWYLEALPNQRSTRRNGKRIKGRIPLAKNDLLQAANSWLLITAINA